MEVDDKFDELVSAEKRHRELMGVLQRLIESQPKPDQTVKESLAAQLKVLEGLVRLLSETPQPQAPIVNVSSNHDEIVAQIRHIAEGMSSQITSLSRPKEWSFSFNRDRNGFISSPIDIKAK